MKMYSEAHLIFLREAYKYLSVPELTEAFNNAFKTSKTEGQIKSALSNHRIVSGRNPGNPANQPRLLTLEQHYFVKELYISFPIHELTTLLNDTYGTQYTALQVKHYIKKHGIISGRTGCFEKGHSPWNTGTKGAVKPNSGCFKKGQKPKNMKPFGHERICPKDGSVLIKVDEINPYTGARGFYRAKHVVLWEKDHGPVPPGHIVSFRDGDRTNLDPSNFELIERKLLCRMNKARVNDFPAALVPSMKTVVKLKLKIFERFQSLDQAHQ